MKRISGLKKPEQISEEILEANCKEKEMKGVFVQDIVLSTLFQSFSFD